MRFNLLYKRFGTHSVLIEWPQVISETVLNDVLNFKVKIENSSKAGVVTVTNAYNSILITYDIAIFNFENELLSLKEIYKSFENTSRNRSKLWRIPVCYDTVFGLDLELLSTKKKISKAEIIKRHTQVSYTVYFIGFLPGFLYLGGLDETISMPRKATPRLKIDKGAVAIGGNQTGIYPNESPGGWNIIGNSPINFFDSLKSEPCFAKAGDKIEFYDVPLKKYHDIKLLVDTHVYEIENQTI